jgi:hypothetical protein
VAPRIVGGLHFGGEPDQLRVVIAGERRAHGRGGDRHGGGAGDQGAT